MVSLTRLTPPIKTYIIGTLIGTLISFSIGFFGYKFLSRGQEVTKKVANIPQKNIYIEPTIKDVPPLPNEEEIPPPAPLELTEYDNDELLGFPIYPNSKFISKTVYPRSEDAVPHYLHDIKEFNWNTTDDFDTVSSFYNNKTNISGTQWSCMGISGERGGPRDGSGGTICNKGNRVINLILAAAPFKPYVTKWIIKIYKEGEKFENTTY
jgi:hypothetical protein